MIRPTKNWQWNTPPNSSGGYSWDCAQLSVLMDIRDELMRLNALLGCSNAMAIPRVLRTIAENTTKPKRKRR